MLDPGMSHIHGKSKFDTTGRRSVSRPASCHNPPHTRRSTLRLKSYRREALGPSRTRPPQAREWPRLPGGASAFLRPQLPRLDRASFGPTCREQPTKYDPETRAVRRPFASNRQTAASPPARRSAQLYSSRIRAAPRRVAIPRRVYLLLSIGIS